MTSLIALKSLYIGALLVLLLSGGALAAWLVRGRSADALIHSRLLQRPRLWVWWLMALCLAVLPFSAWLFVHEAGLSLGQTWVLSSSLLYTLGIIAWAWLLARLSAAAGRPLFSLVLAAMAALCFAGMAALLVSRPG